MDMLAGTSSEDGLTIARVDVPEPGPGQVLVRVAAAGMNRADLNAAKGAGVASKASLGKAIGMEWAGEIVALGSGVANLALGDRVACSGVGGYAEFAVADAGRCLPIERSFNTRRAAGLPLALMTAHNALVTEGGFVAGRSVLVHGATSAVGIATMRIARLLRAGRILATSTTPAKRDKLVELGADAAIDPVADGWSDAVLAQTDGRGADIVVDMVTGPGLNETMKATTIHGTIVNVGRLGGLRCDLDLDLHSARRLRLTGVTFRTRTIDEIRAINAAVRDALWPHVVEGRLELPIARTFPLKDAVEAHAYMAANRHLGKVLLIP